MATAEVKPASSASASANEAVKTLLPFSDEQDFVDAERGFIATWDEPTITDETGQVVWDFEAFAFLKGPAPPEVNPSLWRMAQLNAIHGLFEVTPNIFQVRGFDLSVMSIIEGETGIVVVDPLLSKETSKAAMTLYRKHRGDKPVVAVIYTHSHVDHFGGVKGVVDSQDVASGKVAIVAPEGFMQYAVSENVFAGNAMSRRATYMYGSLLPKSPQGTVDAGLGKTSSSGELTLIPPTDLVTETGQKMRLAGIEFVFLNAPGSEAPAELMFFIPEFEALCSAEDVTHTMHNLYTLRGAEVRDSIRWSRYLQELLTLWGEDTKVMFASHHWPTWGNARVIALIENQRDLYKYIHDQTLRLANQGHTMLEIAELLELPPELDRVWANRGYYGTNSHNAKAVYQKYLGWFDGNPAHLHSLPPAEAAKKYVEFMGGAENVLKQAKATFDAGDYRWTAQVLSHVVFAEPSNDTARFLLADALEQMGYQAESGPWRGFYLTGAMELRQGVRDLPAPKTVSADVLAGMTPEMLFDFMAVRLNPERTAGKVSVLHLEITGGTTPKQYSITLENSVLNYLPLLSAGTPDAKLSLDTQTLAAINDGSLTLLEAVKQNKATITGDSAKFVEFFGYFDLPEFWFPLVTPSTERG